MSPRHIDDALRGAVDRGAVPNVVAVAADGRDVIYEGACGPLTAGESGPISVDSMFRIASMTKIVCTVAALQQRDRGILDFDAPVDAYCHDFASLQILDGFVGGQPRMRHPASRATVKQLLTHTAGLAYPMWNADLVRWGAATRNGDVGCGRNGPFASPLVADPGTRFVYGIGTDWLGRVIEAAGGQRLDDYLTEHILEPLGMSSTTFRPTAAQRARLVPVHTRRKDRSWVATDFDWEQDPDWRAGGHGLYSTPRDFLQFQRMLLGGGSMAGTMILQRSSVHEAFTNQIGDLWVPAEVPTADPQTSCDLVIGPGMKWGWGLLLNTRRQTGMRSARSGAWAGIFNTYFWVDPRSRVAGAVFTQSRPFMSADALQTYGDFERTLYASITGRELTSPGVRA